MGKRLLAAATIMAIVLLVLMFYRFAGLASRGGASLPLYSFSRKDAYGCAALRDLLQLREGRVHVLDRPVIPPEWKGTLIQVLPVRSGAAGVAPVSTPRYQVRPDDLETWLRRGNTIIQLTRAETALMRHLGLVPEQEATEEDTDSVAAPPPGTASPVDSAAISAAGLIEEKQRKGVFPDELPATLQPVLWTEPALALLPERLPPLAMVGPGRFTVAGEKGCMVLARDMGGHVVAWSMNVGKGRLVVLGSPDVALNHAVDQGGNLPFLLASIGSGPVVLDEWSHGIGHATTVMELIREAGLVPVVLQLLFLLGLYIWSVSGQARPECASLERIRSSAEQIRTLGYLYRMSLNLREVFARTRVEVLRRLSQTTGTAPDALEALHQREPDRLPPTANRVLGDLGQAAYEVALRADCRVADLQSRVMEAGARLRKRRRDRDEREAKKTPHADDEETRQAPDTGIEARLARMLTRSYLLAKEKQRGKRTHR